jgi:hypothetical protein
LQLWLWSSDISPTEVTWQVLWSSVRLSRSCSTNGTCHVTLSNRYHTKNGKELWSSVRYKVSLFFWWECSYYGCIQSFLVLLLGGNVPIMDAYKVFLRHSHQVRERKKTLYTSIIGTFPPSKRIQENFVCIIMDAYKVFLCSLTWWECSYYECIRFLVFSDLVGMFLLWMHTSFPLSTIKQITDFAVSIICWSKHKEHFTSFHPSQPTYIPFWGIVTYSWEARSNFLKSGSLMLNSLHLKHSEDCNLNLITVGKLNTEVNRFNK